jgi:CRP/FNR family transcriptional regulator
MNNCEKQEMTDSDSCINKACPPFVDCGDCTMAPVCTPIKTSTGSITLTQNYLSKQTSTYANDAIFTKGEQLSSIYAVSSGLYKLTDINENNEERILGFRFPGELIGEDAIYPKRYSYNAIAIGNSSACKVNIDALLSCSKIVPNLQANLIELLNKQCYLSQQEFRALISRKSAESLLVAFLLNINKRKSQHEHSTTILNLPISRDNIANFLGLRRETLSRIFSKLQKEQLILVTGKNIQFLQPEKLTLLSNI